MKNVSLFFLIILAFACAPEKPFEEQVFLDSLNNLKLEGPKISEEVITDIIQQVPSPLEISYLLKNVGTQYDFDILNSPSNSPKYNSNFRKALNLGVYGTDLGYANIYEQNQDAILFLNSIKSLANDLSIGQFFDFTAIARLATNGKNMDSLLLITTQNFNNINAYLQEDQRSNLSVLILTGGWLEALHVTCQVAEKNPDNQMLLEKIGEQKIILHNINAMLGFYTHDPHIADFRESILELERAYAQIEIVYSYAEPTLEEVNGILMVKDNSTTTINITKDHVDAIRQEVVNIRRKIIS